MEPRIISFKFKPKQNASKKYGCFNLTEGKCYVFK